mmetsp:Transcript_15749/g.24474  ORF Transcript_15749/g.24474 Transcript_15749/m.24474 type:complete len:150 (-) Transcript_15749:1698-2147(-)
MSQAADAEDVSNDRAAEVDESYDDLCEVDIPFSMIDDGSSDDDDKLEQQPESSKIDRHTEKLNENAVMDCFNFSVNAHIKGKFEHVATNNNDTKITSEAKEGKEMDKFNDDKEVTIEQNSAKSSKTDPGDREKGWFPASLPLPAWAASD